MHKEQAEKRMEKWLPVVGFEGYYEVSNLGRVRSIERMSRINSVHNGKRKMGGVYRKMSVNRFGYIQIALTANGKRENRDAHRMVLESFVGPCPNGMECCHANGDSTDNRLPNLRWDTHYNNNQDRKRHGNYSVGSKHHAAKLNETDVTEILHSSLSGVKLASRFEVHPSTISDIRKRKIWKHVF